MPRGRSYVRNGSVVDLQIAKGTITALVAGSRLYDLSITIVPVKSKCWTSICADCAGSIDSLVELLQGRLSKAVMDRVCRKGDGLFPAPEDIKLACSCPDWADMCKHVAAVLYGVGARLDDAPELLFLLRDVDANELLANAGRKLDLNKTAPPAGKLLDDGDVAALFGLEMAGDGASDKTSDPPPRAKTSKSRKTTKARKTAAARAGTKGKAATKKSVAKKTAAKKVVSKSGVARKNATKKGIVTKTVAKKGITKKAAANKAASAKKRTPKSRSRSRSAPRRPGAGSK